MRHIRIGPELFDAGRESARLAEGRPDAGALVVFTGLCRDEGGRLSALEIEHYPGMADAEIERVVAEAEERWPIIGAMVVHRVGFITPGEPIMFVATASVHRAAAFEAASYLMDYLKTYAPFWKRERLRDGEVGPWVEARASDDEAAGRWASEGQARDEQARRS